MNKKCQLINKFMDNKEYINSNYTDVWYWQKFYFDYKGGLTKDNLSKEAQKYREKKEIEYRDIFREKMLNFKYCPYCGEEIIWEELRSKYVNNEPRKR